jgi:hypothetical protein
MSDAQQPTFKNGRKFFVVVMACILLAIGMVAGLISAWKEFELPWLATVLPILAGALPTYIGFNAYQKGKELEK